MPKQKVDQQDAVVDGAQPDEEAIRDRAYEISQRPDAGSPEDNWDRAIAELRAEQESSVGGSAAA